MIQEALAGVFPEYSTYTQEMAAEFQDNWYINEETYINCNSKFKISFIKKIKMKFEVPSNF